MDFLKNTAKSVLGGTSFLREAARGLLRGNEVTYAAEPDLPSVQIPKQTQQDFSKVDVTKVDSPQFAKYNPLIAEAARYAKELTGVDVPPYLLAATFHQESTAGMNKTNYNPKIGEYAWMMGMTDSARKTLEQNKYKVDLNSEQGVFNASALYYANRAKSYNYDPKTDTRTLKNDYTTNPALWYAERYNAHPQGAAYESIKKDFPGKVGYYQTNYK